MLPDTDFLQGYGMTEAAIRLTFLSPEIIGVVAAG